MDWLNELTNNTVIWREANWLWALLLPIALWLLNLLRKQQNHHRFADSHLWPWLTPESSDHTSGIKQRLKRWFSLSPSHFLTLAWWCLIVALAGPRTEIQTTDQQSRASVDILISIDLSRSMLAEDVYPNRFLFSRSLIELLSQQLQRHDRIALQGFAGDAHMVSPLTTDRTLFQHALQLLSPTLLPLQGSWLERALDAGQQHLQQTAGTAKVHLIWTDGAPDFWQPKSSAFASPDTSIQRIIIGVGHPVPATIPDTEHPSGHLHVNGLLVQSPLYSGQLKQLANALQAPYMTADQSPAFMQQLLDTIAQAAQQQTTTQPKTTWQDHAHPFIVAGFIFLLAAFFIRGWIGSVSQRLRAHSNSVISGIGITFICLSTLSISPDSFAGTASQNAYQAYQDKRYVDAQQLYEKSATPEDWLGAGSAAYQNGDYETAIYYFREAAWTTPSDALRASALFNLGNSYYQANLMVLAIEAYQQALNYQPNHFKAQRNIQLALQMLAEQQAQQGNEQTTSSSQQRGDDEGAFYGGQKVNRQQGEIGFGDGDVSSDNNGKSKAIIPLDGEQTDYQLSIEQQTLTIQSQSGGTTQQRILLQQKKQQQAAAFEQALNQIEDDQQTLLKRLFEREAGFHAPQESAHPIPGVQPW